MPASKSMKIKSVRYNAIVSRPNLAEKNSLSEKPQAKSEDESSIRKQELIMMTRVIEDAIKQKKEGNKSPFYELIRQINDISNVNHNPKKLRLWCLAFSRIMHKFDATCSDLVYTLLNFNWTNHDNNLAIAYVMMLANLVAVYPSCTEAMLEMLVQNFLYKEDEVSKMEKIHGKVHYAIKTLLPSIPQEEKDLFHVLYREFPHKRESLGAYIVYVKNLLQLIEYTPSLQHKILTLIFERMIELDTEVQGQIDEIEDMEEGLNKLNIDLHTSQDGSTDFYKSKPEEPDFEIFNDTNADNSDSDIEDSVPIVIAVDIANGIQKLDCIIKLVLDYLDYSHKNGTREQRTKLTETIFTIFKESILYTIKSRYIQFIPFWYFSLDKLYASRFIKLLLDKLIDDEGKEITREAAAQYIASYIARAKYLNDDDVMQCMRALIGWAKNYVSAHKNLIHVDESKHEKFYRIVQTVMYVFCFRWRDFCNTTSGNNIWNEEIKELKDIVESVFCPLKFCVENTVKMFTFIAKSTGFMTCKEYKCTKIKNDSVLSMEEYFPFDPFRLKTSQTYLEELYQVWEEIPEKSDEEE
ncbi:RNA polymerase I-specific transcription initiation factor RRN3 [Rhizophagus diaphanus]|nr:RNA polymerase I-specific transcription initiation factor RRN3 [Rhizophagus diaphanus] [Rhizophagus sp. MUCL 43196]